MRDADQRIIERSSEESYCFFFEKGRGQWCMDATIENGTLERLLKHSRHRNAKAQMIIDPRTKVPHLIFFASAPIDAGEEILWDYGDTRRNVAPSWMYS